MQTTASPVRVWTALAVVYVVWGSTYLAIRFSLETMPPLLSAGVRFLVAGLLLAAIMAARSGVAVFRTGWRRARNGVASGLLLLVGGNGMVVVAETHLPSGLTALLVAAVPLWLILLRLGVGDRLPSLTYAGVLLGFVGVGLLFLRSAGGRSDPWFAALVLLAALSWACGSLLATRAPVPESPAVLSTFEMVAAGAALTGMGLVRGEAAQVDLGAVSTKSWLALVYLVLFGSLLAFSAYVWVLGHAPTSLVSTYAYVNPAVAVLLGVLLAGERLTALEVAGGAVILLAVVLVVRAERPVAAQPEPAEADVVRGSV